VIRYLLDTNIVSYLMRGKHPQVLERLTSRGPDQVAISVLTALELREGADRSADPARYHAIIDRVVGGMATLPFPAEAAATGGSLRAWLKRQGVVMGDIDTLIATHALVLHVTLVTNDSAFALIKDLRVENWI
jgi:tRNA(fMet)-specific endonuclease VapC